MTIEIAADASRLRRARVAVSLAFLVFGTLLGLWFAHLPVIAGRLHLDPGPLSLGLLSIGVIGLVMQSIAGLAIARFGSRRAAMVLLPIMAITAILLINSPTQPMFYLFCAVVGLVGSPANVANNTMAAEWERLHGRPAMSSFHGFFSLGGLLGAVLGGSIIAAGYGDGRGAIVVGVVLLAAAIWATWNSLDIPPQPVAPRTGPRFALPASALLGICVLALFCNVIEGSIGDWSALYLHTVKGADTSLAAAGYGMFSVAMALLRFAGGPIVERLGKKVLVAGGGAVMAAGLLIVVLSPWPLVSALGFLVVAIGASNISPVLTSTAANTPGVAPSVGIAALSTFMTFGYLAGPPIIGFVAQAWGLGAGLGLVALLGVVVAVGAGARRWEPAAVAAE
jgi:predicted MFS family arabinose efflux permease